jgi:predicted DNA-binding transcriptional regulator AlpA
MARKIDFEKTLPVGKPVLTEEKIVVEESGIIQEIMDKKYPGNNDFGTEKFVINKVDKSFRLYSLNKVCKLLKIGRATLNNYINAGQIGVVLPPPGSKQSKIPHSEIEKFLSEQIVREQKQQFTTNFTNRDVNEFINGNKSRKNDMKNFDSNKLFDQILEQHNGKRV